MLVALLDFLHPETLIHYGGLTVLLLIIFSETGLFFGFFLPGDSLLFIAGLLCETPYLDTPVVLLILLLVVAAFAGTTVGYFFGKWAGNYLQHRKENFFYKKKYLDITRNFYKDYGMMAFVIGRFLPIVRTFVPILAGMIKIEVRPFVLFNLLGAVCWVVPLVLLGHWLGNLFPDLIDYIELIIIGMVVFTAIPVVRAYRKHAKTSRIH